MARDWDQTRLQRYIDEGLEESLTLEYKSGLALSLEMRRAKEIAKDVSAMANSAGGLIIYGIAEGDTNEMAHRPCGFVPVDRRECSKETLEQIVNSNVQPRIGGLKIYPVPLDSDPTHVAYVVSIPQSDTAHQVSRTKRYYRRFNFESVPMEDYELRDVLNRVAHPEVETRVGHMSYQVTAVGQVWSVPIFVKNSSLQVAKDTAVTVQFLDDAPENGVVPTERFQLKTQPKPNLNPMYISTFGEAIHRGLNKYFGTFDVIINEPQALTMRLQIFSNGMRAKWWVVKLNFGATSATIQVLDEGYLY